MAQLSEQQQRIQWYLQEDDPSPTRQQQLAVAHQEELQRLARDARFGSMLWVQAVTGQALYTLPAPTVDVAYVLYNERVLHYASEAQLDRRRPGWEATLKEPAYWTTNNLGPYGLRIIPAPLRTGSAVLNPAFVPLPQSTVDNLVLFVYDDLSGGLTDPVDTVPVLDSQLDLLVLRTTATLARRETREQNIPLADLCTQLAALWERYM